WEQVEPVVLDARAFDRAAHRGKVERGTANHPARSIEQIANERSDAGGLEGEGGAVRDPDGGGDVGADLATVAAVVQVRAVLVEAEVGLDPFTVTDHQDGLECGERLP